MSRICDFLLQGLPNTDCVLLMFDIVEPGVIDHISIQTQIPGALTGMDLPTKCATKDSKETPATGK